MQHISKNVVSVINQTQNLKIKMSKEQDWLETLVKKYSLPKEDKKEKRGILSETQLKNLKDGKD